MATALPILSMSSAVRASSVDTGQRLSYNPQRTYPKKPENLTAASPSTSTTTPNKNAAKISISNLLKRDIWKDNPEEVGGSYMGYETWLPTAPKVEKPRSVFNPASLAYVGDCIYELYARRHFLFPPLNIEEYNDRVMAVVRCEAQVLKLDKVAVKGCNATKTYKRQLLITRGEGCAAMGEKYWFLKNKNKKRAGVAAYNRASSLETLVGYLYLTNAKRLDEVMEKIGFSIDTSTLLKQ